MYAEHCSYIPYCCNRASLRRVAELSEQHERFLGRYASAWGEEAVIAWEGKLAVIGLPSRDPVDGLARLEHLEGNRFRRVRDDGVPAEEWVFEEDSNGKITGLRRHGNGTRRVADL